MNFWSTKPVQVPVPASALTNGVDASFVAARPYFIVGELIQGNLTVSSAFGAVVIGSVQAEITCIAEGFYLREEYNEKLVGYSVTNLYFRTSPMVLFEARPIGGMAVSSMTQPVTIPIPTREELPSTVTGTIDRFALHKDPMTVKYSLKLTTFGMNGEVLNNKTSALDIRALYVYPNPEKPLKICRTEMTGGCCGSPKSVTIFCVTDRTVYGPGDRIRLSYWYEASNPANHPKIASIEVSMSFIIKSLKAMPVMNSDKFFSKDVEIPSLGKVTTLNIDVPASVVPNFTLSGAPHVLEYKHVLSVIVRFERIEQFLVIPVPVVFNTLSSAQLAQVQYPVLQKPLPQLAIEAQALYASDPNLPGVGTTH